MVAVKSNLVAAVLLGASAVNAHIKMTSPKPYNNPDNSPLTNGGANFPCKVQNGQYTDVPATEYNVGDEINVELEGSAVHGGGSCQISLTSEVHPKADTKWQVIKSIEGGCPANTDGNMGSNSGTKQGPFTAKIPDDFKPGQYTMAWTWFNRIGNREMYMNCAPIKIKGSSKRSETPIEKRSNYPDMFVANIFECKTPESVDIRFPNPGDNIQYLGDKQNIMQKGQAACPDGPHSSKSTGPASSSGGSSGSSSGGSSGSSSGGSSGSSSSGVGSSPTQAPAAGGAQFAPESASSSEASAAVPTSAAPAAESSSSSSGSSPSSSASASGSSGGGSCSGDVYDCIDGKSFKRCANNQWSAVMQMAAGTECTVGQNSNLDIKASASKKSRSLRKRRNHGPHRHA